MLAHPAFMVTCDLEMGHIPMRYTSCLPIAAQARNHSLSHGVCPEWLLGSVGEPYISCSQAASICPPYHKSDTCSITYETLQFLMSYWCMQYNIWNSSDLYSMVHGALTPTHLKLLYHRGNKEYRMISYEFGRVEPPQTHVTFQGVSQSFRLFNPTEVPHTTALQGL